MVEWDGPRVRTSVQNWRRPLAWNRLAEFTKTRRRVFCASLADVFDNQVPEEWRTDLWNVIRATPALDWQLLTKRIGNAAAMLPADWGEGWPNVWLGATVINQEEADRDIPKLLHTPAQIRFLSCEPLLGPIDLMVADDIAREEHAQLDWLICGGESGREARSMDLNWARELLADCDGYGIAFFMKQLSRADLIDFKNFDAFPKDLQVREWPRP